MRKNTIARKPFVCTCPNGIYPLQKENSRSQTCLYLSKFFRFLRDTAVSAFNSFGSIRVCAAEPRPDFRYRSNANDGKAWLCRVLPRELAPKRKQQVSNLLLYISKFFCFLRDTAVSAFNSFCLSVFVRRSLGRIFVVAQMRTTAKHSFAAYSLEDSLQTKKNRQNLFFFVWSGKRDSNSRHLPWQGNALPLSHSRILVGTIGLEPMTPCL